MPPPGEGLLVGGVEEAGLSPVAPLALPHGVVAGNSFEVLPQSSPEGRAHPAREFCPRRKMEI